MSDEPSADLLGPTPDQARELTPDYNLLLAPKETDITGKDGRSYTVRTFQPPTPLGETLTTLQASHEHTELAKKFAEMQASVVALAKRCFPNWTDGGKFFEGRYAAGDMLSLIVDPETQETVGFNLYKRHDVQHNGQTYTDMYLNYVGVAPEYRRRGLMEESIVADIVTADADVFSAASAVGEVHRGFSVIAERSGRLLEPEQGGVNYNVGKLGQEIYVGVYGERVRASVDPTTLVRKSEDAYTQGEADSPLRDILNLEPNEAVILLLMKPEVNTQLLAQNLPKVQT